MCCSINPLMQYRVPIINLLKMTSKAKKIPIVSLLTFVLDYNVLTGNMLQEI